MIIISGVLNWIQDVKQGISLARLARSSREGHVFDMNLIARMQERSQIWNSQELINNSFYGSQVQQHTPYEAYNISFGNEENDPNALYSNGRTGHKIVRSAEICRKTLGMYTRWELFYIALRHEEETSFSDFIYLSTDGIAKHDDRVVIEGVDLV